MRNGLVEPEQSMRSVPVIAVMCHVWLPSVSDPVMCWAAVQGTYCQAHYESREWEGGTGV